jgi:hypothetical protein
MSEVTVHQTSARARPWTRALIGTGLFLGAAGLALSAGTTLAAASSGTALGPNTSAASASQAVGASTGRAHAPLAFPTMGTVAADASTPGATVTTTDTTGHVYEVNTVSGKPTTREPATSTKFANDADLVYASAQDTGTTLNFTAKTVESNTDASYTPATDPNWTENDTYIGWQLDSNSGANPNYAVYFQLKSTGKYDGALFHLQSSGFFQVSCVVNLSYSQSSGYAASLSASCLGGARSFAWNVFSNYDTHSTDVHGRYAIGKALPDPYDGGARYATTVTAGTPVPAPAGYWLAASDGGVFTFGKNVTFYGSMGTKHLNAPIVGGAATPDGLGYWMVASDGGIFTFGDALFYGSTGAMHLNQPIVGMAVDPAGDGYWLVASDGGIFSFGGANFHGSTGAMHLNAPIVGMAAAPTGVGYWLVASDGGIFTFGKIGFFGSEGGKLLSNPIVGLAAVPSGGGYWLVSSNGVVYPLGDAPSYGQRADLHLNLPVDGIGAAPTGSGYWLVADDGGVFTYGQVSFFGSTGNIHLNAPVKAVAVAVAG